MKVILSKDIPNLGEEGEILEVAPGYARNFLIPQNMVLPFNKQNLAILEGKKAAIEKRKEEKRKAALSDKDKINTTAISIAMPAGDNGKLFGAVTAQMIVDQLAAKDITVERKKVEIPGHTLKALGDYKLRIRLYGNEEAELKLTISRETGSSTEKAKESVKETPAKEKVVEEKKEESVVEEVAAQETAVQESTEQESTVQKSVVEEPAADASEETETSEE